MTKKLINYVFINSSIHLLIIRRHESICIWFCWCTWRWDQVVFYIRYLKRL